jgi:hypothetical protein
MHHRYTLDEKWVMNRFLQKWLGYCLRQGHRFNPGAATLLSPETAPLFRDSLLVSHS